MKTIQMWRDFNYPKELIACAKTVINIVGKDNYEIFCTNPEISKELGNVNWKNFDDEYQKALLAQKNIDWWKTYCSTNYFMSDLIRLHYATFCPDLFYLDMDIQLLYKVILEKNYIYFLQGDFCMFAVNGNTEWFNFMIEDVTQCSPIPMVIYSYLAVNKPGRIWKNFPKNYYKRINFGKQWKK